MTAETAFSTRKKGDSLNLMPAFEPINCAECSCGTLNSPGGAGATSGVDEGGAFGRRGGAYGSYRGMAPELEDPAGG